VERPGALLECPERLLAHQRRALRRSGRRAAAVLGRARARVPLRLALRSLRPARLRPEEPGEARKHATTLGPACVLLACPGEAQRDLPPGRRSARAGARTGGACRRRRPWRSAWSASCPRTCGGSTGRASDPGFARWGSVPPAEWVGGGRRLVARWRSTRVGAAASSSTRVCAPFLCWSR